MEFKEPNFAVVEAAISDRVGMSELEINAFDATTSILKTRREMPELAALDVRPIAKVDCRTTTLDLIFEQSKLPPVCGFVKIGCARCRTSRSSGWPKRARED